MTTIKATCPTCGEVGLTPHDIELRVDRQETDASFYAFKCPTCDGRVRKPADERVIRLLISGGVAVLETEAEPEPPKPRFEGPAISHDDLLDFHALLQSPGWFDQIRSLVRD
ncbi:MAG TPA: hypothetical protein VML96_13675 [Egibacteraceae bacterium]|nr:hypothetical protein [Egibacteraceae bacterium]